MLPHVGANFHNGALESSPSIRSAERRRVNGWDARVGHQELLARRKPAGSECACGCGPPSKS
eukprot:975494-Pleurochrysis_carterae.AAC.1